MTLIFCIHYFLWYGALTSIFGYEMVYARQYTNSTTMQFGYLNMILPFATVITTPIICSMADRNRSHRSYFTVSLVLTTISFSLYGMLPLIMGTPPLRVTERQAIRSATELNIFPWVYFCLTSLLCNLAMGVNTCLSDSFAVLQAEERGTSFGRVIVWGTFGWAVSALILCGINQWPAVPRLLPGILFGTFLLAIDVMIVTFWERPSDFMLDTIPVRAALTLTGTTSPSHKDPSDYMPSNESARVNIGTGVNEDSGLKYRRTKSPLQIVKDEAMREEEEKLAAKQIKELSGSNRSYFESTIQTINSELDNVISNETNSTQSGKNGAQMKQAAGKQIIPAQDSSNKSEGKDEKLASFRLQLILLGFILKKRRSLIRYLILFVMAGFFMSMHWNYFFLYLEEIHRPKFELITAFSMIGQSLLGELPFFILSKKFIQFFGRSHTLSLSIMSIGLRFILYRYFLPNVNMYFVVIPDCFQGPNYGLFYVVMTEVGLEYSYCDDDTIDDLAARGEIDINNQKQVDNVRLSLRSTVQSVAFACYEGLGVGLGSLVGGWITHSYGFKMLWTAMAIGSISVGALNVLLEVLWTEEELEEERSERREFMRAHRDGTLKEVARPHPFPAPNRLGPFKRLEPAKAKFVQMLARNGGRTAAPPNGATGKQV